MRIPIILSLATTAAALALGGLLHPAAKAADAARASTPAAESSATPADTSSSVEPAKETDGVRSIPTKTLPVELPDAPGKNLIAANCVICHTPNYIMMQPPFPRKVWEAEVTKMRTTFGAPIPEALVPQIVDYLVAARGLKE